MHKLPISDKIEYDFLLESYSRHFEAEILPVLSEVVLLERKLKHHEIEALFRQIELARSGKTIIGKTIDNAKEIPAQYDEIKNKLVSLYNAAKTHEFTKKIQSGAETSIAYASEQIALATEKAKQAIKRSGVKENVEQYIDELSAKAKKSPLLTAYVIAVMGSVVAMVDDPAVGASFLVALLLRGALEIATKNTTESISEAGLMDIAKNIGNRLVNGKPEIPYDTLYAEWVRLGKPTNDRQIFNMVKKMTGMSGIEFETILQQTMKNKPEIIHLATQIKKANISTQVVKVIDDIIANGDFLQESIMEKTLSDKDIRQLFVKLSDTKKQNPESVANVNGYVKKWSSEINAESDKNKKISMVKEIVNFLADRFDTPEWKNVVKGVQNIIKSSQLDPNFIGKANISIDQGKILERKLFNAITSLLVECDLSWESMNMMPVLTENNRILLKNRLLNKKIMESFFDNVVTYDLVYVKTIGRRLKA